jgi:predicted O-methyltransferase YrrM
LKIPNYQFTTDWFGHVEQIWLQKLPQLIPEDPVCLEIGSWEGRSTLWILEHLRPKSLVCIDTWEGASDQKEHFAELIPGVFNRFKHNIAQHELSDRVETLMGRSFERLMQLICSEKIQFDFIYVDGSHESYDVLADGMLGFELLKSGGIMIFDDYLWDTQRHYYNKPQYAIDVFQRLFEDKMTVIWKANQVWIRKK